MFRSTSSLLLAVLFSSLTSCSVIPRTGSAHLHNKVRDPEKSMVKGLREHVDRLAVSSGVSDFDFGSDLDHRSANRMYSVSFPPKITLLGLAATYGNVDAARYLIDLGVDPNKGNSDGVTPLHFSILINDTKMAELLLKNGANPNLKIPESDWEPLEMCFRENKKDIGRVIIRFGGKIYIKDDHLKNDLEKWINSL